MKKILALLLALSMVLSLAACTSSESGTTAAGTEAAGTTAAQETDAQSGSGQDGTYTASAQGYGGEVTVEMTFEGGAITAVTITGDSETATIGQAAIPTLEEEILSAQSAEIDGVSGATATSKAVMTAAQSCIDQYNGVAQTAQAELADGTYTAAAWSFATNRQLNVTVEVADNKMTSIEVGDNGDTEIILNTAIEYMIPQMLEYQSVSVDSITGATTSSNAIKQATEDCLVQAIEAAGGDPASVSAFYVTPEKSTAQETLDTDVLVVGMGGAGITTATRIVESLNEAYGGNTEDIHVLSIDKAAKYGGTSVTTTSPMSINPSYFVEQNNGEDYVDADVLKAAWMEYTEGDAKEWAIDYMMDYSGEAVDWLIGKGFVFGEPAQGLSDPYKVCVNYGAQFAVSKSVVQTYFDAIMDTYEELGGEYMLQVEATDLIVEDGVITGVHATGADGTSYTINADKVVLATGGFAGNGEMEDEYLSDEYYNLSGGGRYNLFGMSQNDGKMIQSAIDNGAATYNIGMPPVSHIGGAYKIMHEFPVIELEDAIDIWTGLPATQSLNDIPMMMAVAPDSLAVNRQGVRFTDETTLSGYGNWQAGAYYYTIWSSEQIANIAENGLQFDTIGIFVNQGGWPANTPISEIYDILEAGIEMDYIYKADTLEELAEQIGVDPATLTETVSNYNEYCETKENPADGIEKAPVIYDLSGNPLEGDYDVYQKVEGDGPYYAVKGSPWIYSTTGALDVNEQFQVLNTEGEPMEGLYAVGTDCLGILFTEKKAYVTYGGADQGWAFTSGYLAGGVIADSILNGSDAE